ncbi:hypothetical protein [Leisingera sp. ANG-M1]|uniref:hypothetical protein n=1 Tax=Leisingera sp. ANG-M1 TaxID=1577895 RepID=UPI00057FE0B8|nr:hypothetical protein [Leisingera sp. ANG-M1]
MAKGNVFEEFFEVTFEVAARVFYPRSANGSILQELSWTWGGVLALLLVALHTSKRVSDLSDLDGDLKTMTVLQRNKFITRLVLWAAALIALFMTRFASWL